MDREGWKPKTRQTKVTYKRGVLHRILYPNAHENGFKKKSPMPSEVLHSFSNLLIPKDRAVSP